MAVKNDGPISKRVPVPVEGQLYLKLRAYSQLTGVPVARIVHAALVEYEQTVLAARMETLSKYCNGDRAIPVAEVPPLIPSAAFTADDAMSDAVVLEAAPPAPTNELPDWAKD